MRREAMAAAFAFAAGTLLVLATLSLFADDAPPLLPASVKGEAPLAEASVAARSPYDLANASFVLGLGQVGPVNTTVVLKLDIPANLTGVRVVITPTEGASIGLRASGIGACSHSYGNVAASSEPIGFDCTPAPPGHHDLTFAQDSGRISLAVRVIAIPR